GALLPNAGCDLPIPTGARLSGSVLRLRTNAKSSFDTVLDIPGTADDLTSFYERVLEKTGLSSAPALQGMQPGAFQGTARPAQRLPALHAPDGLLLQSSGSSYGGPRQQSDAVATTPKTAAELEAFFAQQLAAAGWTRVAGGANTPLAFSTWKVPGDGDWQGVLIVIEMPAKDRRSLMLRAESPTGFR